MLEISVTARALEQTPGGPIIEIAFDGYYPPGSAGNEPCAKMIERARGSISDMAPSGVLFNLRHLDYVWGDSIGGLAYLVVRRPQNTIIPACVVATGRTAKALRFFFFIKGHVFVIAGMRLFENEAEALQFLRTTIEAATV
jgi:hypothetical protein